MSGFVYKIMDGLFPKMNKLYKYNPDFETPCPNCRHTSAVHEFVFEQGKEIYLHLKCNEYGCDCGKRIQVMVDYK